MSTKLVVRTWRALVPQSVRDAVYRGRAGLENFGRCCLGGVSRWLPSSYKCSVCGGGVRRFVPLPTEHHERNGFDLVRIRALETLNVEQYACGWCGASDRDRLSALFIRRFLDERSDSTVRLLDIAPSHGLQNFLRRTRRFDYRSADLLRDDVDDRVDLQDMSLYANDTFGAIICSHVLEHVPDDRRALRELYRVLQPGGWCLLMVPILLTASSVDEDPLLTDEAERIRRFGQRDHVRMYNKAGFVSRLVETGGKVEMLGEPDFGEDAFRQCGIGSQSVLYLLQKQPLVR